MPIEDIESGGVTRDRAGCQPFAMGDFLNIFWRLRAVTLVRRSGKEKGTLLPAQPPKPQNGSHGLRDSVDGRSRVCSVCGAAQEH
jgi:hypothetical protein